VKPEGRKINVEHGEEDFLKWYLLFSQLFEVLDQIVEFQLRVTASV
jgi:hypothetical protein